MQKLLIRGSVIAAALVFGACHDATEPVAVAGSGGSGNDTECVGPMTGVHENVVVPPDAFCALDDATVNGNVKALENSQLFITNSTIRGNVDGDKAFIVDIFAFRERRNLVLGSIQVKEGDGFVRVCGTDLPNGNIQIEKMRNSVVVGGVVFCGGIGGGNTLATGNIKAEENSVSLLGSGRLEISGNTVGGNVLVFKNMGTGPKMVLGNTVHENLQCFENTPPFVGGPNIANKAEDQCFGAAPAI